MLHDIHLFFLETKKVIVLGDDNLPSFTFSFVLKVSILDPLKMKEPNKYFMVKPID